MYSVALLLLRHALGPPPGSLFAERFALSALRPEFVVPPLASVCFMAAMPIAVAHVGASRAFPLLIAGQLRAAGIGLVPGLIGLAYLAVWRFEALGKGASE